MKYHIIKEKLEKLVTFTTEDIYLVDSNFRLPTLYDWEKKSLVSKIRNNLYVFQGFTPKNHDYFLLANKIFHPSYISLETALNYYNVIPEVTHSVTSVTTNKTNSFKTSFGSYIYQSIASQIFFGYILIEHKNYGVKLASLEKAILDFLYLNTNITSTLDFEGLRWNKEVLIKSIDKETLTKYQTIFNNKALNKRLSILTEYLS